MKAEPALPVRGCATGTPVLSQTRTSPRRVLIYAVLAIVSFHFAYSSSAASFLILLYATSVLQFARENTTRKSFYAGLAVGLLTVGPQLSCFWRIFGAGAIALWLILGFWLAAFCALARNCLTRYGTVWGAILIPFVWTGLGYFRSELYYLRFSWMNVGYALPPALLSPLYRTLGMYGIGFLVMALAVVFSFMPLQARRRLQYNTAAAVVLLALVCAFSEGHTTNGKSQNVRVAAIQMEFPSIADIVPALDRALADHPDTELFVLSEYTLDDTVPTLLKNWCRQNKRYLIIGGKDPAPNSAFYNTAFVVGPTGEIVFQQGKSVPIQFFKDGLPAPEQKLWDSPWGKIGLCICYDLSYTRVTDRLIRSGAQALIVPTMDVMDWGKHQHDLHSRVAPVRAAEYGVPIFRVASSGISQLVTSSGGSIASAGFPGQGDEIFGTLVMGAPGSVPFDRSLGPFASAIASLAFLILVFGRLRAYFPSAAALSR